MAAQQIDFGPLVEKLNAEDYAAALALTRTMIASTPEDAELASCHVFCLMHETKFDDAKAFITSSKLQKQFWFELAYCYYRSNELAESIAVLDKNDKEHLGARQLRAQSLFRLGKYLEAAGVYEKLVGNSEIDPLELRTNLCACYSAAGEEPAIKFLQSFAGQLSESSDLMYNTSCAMIESGNLEGAITMLDQAEAAARSALEEDGAEEDEVDDEVSIFEVQRAYAKQCLGRNDEALDTYEKVLKKKPSDAAVVAVASNNIIALKKDRDLFDSAKKAKAAVSPEVEKKLTYRQRRAFAFNRCLLQLNMNQAKKAEELVIQLEKEYPDSELPCLIRASLLSRAGNADLGKQMLVNYTKKNPGASYRVQLTLAQLQLNTGNVKGAIAILEEINKKKLRLGVSGTLVRMYELVGDVDSALKCVDLAVAAAKAGKTMADEGQKMALMRESAQLNVSHHRYKQAMEALEKLVVTDESVLPMLVKAAAIADPAKAEKFAARLPGIPAGDFDLDALERMAHTRTRRASVAEKDDDIVGKDKKIKTKHPLTEAKKLKLKLKKVKKHVPDYDPAYVPDPERWLPVYMRASSRKGRGAKKNAVKGSQGSTGAASVAPQLTQSVAPDKASVSGPSVPAAARKKAGKR